MVEARWIKKRFQNETHEKFQLTRMSVGCQEKSAVTWFKLTEGVTLQSVTYVAR